MNTGSIKKINKAGKIAHIIIHIVRVCAIVGVITSILGAIEGFTAPASTIEIATTEEFETNENSSLEPGDVYVKVDGEQIDLAEYQLTYNHTFLNLGSYNYSINIKDLAVIMVVSAIDLAVSVVALTFLISLCKAFRDCKSPFEENVVRQMERCAKVAIVWGVVYTLSNTAQGFISSGWKSINISVDMGLVIVLMVVLLLLYIFKYGAELQREADETL